MRFTQKKPDLLITPEGVQHIVKRLRIKHRISATRAEAMVLEVMHTVGVGVEEEPPLAPPHPHLSRSAKATNLAFIAACFFVLGVVVYHSTIG